jgi:hypothetical protein
MPTELDFAALDDIGWEILESSGSDFNSDGHDDVLWHNTNTGSNGFWEMDGSGNFENFIEIPSVDTNSNWQIVGTGDFNSDGNDDVLWRNTNTGSNGFWRMDGNGNFNGFVELPSVDPNSSWQMVGVADFNSDGIDDIVWRNTNTGSNGFWRMDGNSNSNGFVELPTVNNPNWEMFVGRSNN